MTLTQLGEFLKSAWPVLKWFGFVLLCPPLLWIWRWYLARWDLARQREKQIEWLLGLPPEAKAVLMRFYEEGTHTLVFKDRASDCELLMTHGILVRGGWADDYGMGRYYTITARYWELLPEWVLRQTV